MKARWDLLPFAPIAAVVRVLTLGAQKYSEWNWVHVPNARDRYFAAAMRHLIAWWAGDENDPETGESHLAHAICCLVFLASLPKESAERDARADAPTEPRIEAAPPP